MCVMNGHTLAGGLFLALTHNYRVIKKDARVCFSEINVGLGLGNGYMALAQSLLDN